MNKITSLNTFLIAIAALFLIQYGFAQTWVDAGFVPSPGAQPSISVVTSDVAWICGGSGTTPKLFKTINGGLNWTELSVLGLGHELGCVAAISPDIVFVGESIVTGGANLYKTVNGGSTWTSVFQTRLTAAFLMVSFLPKTTVICLLLLLRKECTGQATEVLTGLS